MWRRCWYAIISGVMELKLMSNNHDKDTRKDMMYKIDRVGRELGFTHQDKQKETIYAVVTGNDVFFFAAFQQGIGSQCVTHSYQNCMIN